MLKIIHEPIFPLQQLIIQHYNSYTEAYLIDINFTIIKYQDEKIVSKLQFPQSARPTHIVYNPQTN